MFIVIKGKSVIAAIVMVIVLVGLSLFCVIADIGAFAVSTKRKLPIYSVLTEDKKIALTFDAAWGADKTKAIVNILNENQARGTFFLVGFWIEKYSEEVKFLNENKIEIGNHSNNHLHMSKLNETQIKQEITSVNNQIKELIGITPRFFRPPFGEYNNLLINTLNSLGMQTIQWDVDSLDWKGISAAQIKSRVVSKANNGSIVLFHNNSDHIVEALPSIIKELKQKGFSFVTLSELILKDNYAIDHKGQQYPLNSD